MNIYTDHLWTLEGWVAGNAIQRLWAHIFAFVGKAKAWRGIFNTILQAVRWSF